MGGFLLVLLHSSSLRFVPFFFKRKTGPKKNCGGGTAWRPALVWFSPGNRPPFRPPPEWGGPEVGVSFGLSFFDGGFAAVEGPAGGRAFDGCGSAFFAWGTGRPFWWGCCPSILACSGLFDDFYVDGADNFIA